jgi:hypothetical protein
MSKRGVILVQACRIPDAKLGALTNPEIEIEIEIEQGRPFKIQENYPLDRSREWT